MAFAVPVWLLVAWVLTGTGTGRFLLLLLAMPASFALLLAIALLVRLRPDARERGAMSGRDALLLLVNWLLWGIAAPLGEGMQNLVTILAAAVSLVSVVLLWRDLRRAAGERIRSAAGKGAPRPGGPVITVTDDEARPAASRSGDAEGSMPGSTRTAGGPPRIGSARPGINFGANAAPVADDWDPRRPVRDAEPGLDEEGR